MVRVKLQEKRQTQGDKEYRTYTISIPKHIVDFLGLEKGDEFEVVKGGNSNIILKKVKKT
ncbi:MAG: AbrB/MazE/SpoVT family DNA-binding domain-containing protein [Candidatus Lokiarchaeota archaeon]|nr:AbrB/MazE/SpoVT family DNA-binding domain-containing protein [Candidatus Lokiarchaeota archaeon]